MTTESLIAVSSPVSGTLNPFLIPEILYVLGQNLPLWKKPHGYARVFDPTVFLTCLQVCKLWHYTLTAHLWRVYDQSTMFRIPPEILVKNARFFRFTDNWEIVAVTAGPKDGPENGSRMNGQETQPNTGSGQGDIAARQNINLRQLVLKGEGSDRDTPMSTQMIDVITSFGFLESLVLENWTLEISAIENHLFRNKSRLKTFTLNQCRYRKASSATLEHEEDPTSGFLQLAAIPTICPDLQRIILKPDRAPVQQVEGSPVSDLDTYSWVARLIHGLTNAEGQKVKLRCGKQAMNKIRTRMVRLRRSNGSIDGIVYAISDTDVEDTIEVILRE
ncbi:hypothetical protein BGZ51_003847 [Haplosporangium sp. Z 767]|nr:hypothetical protein BGZ51_003847 [Haplosporangium sp. Z 767]KAF9184280.1 hypothetical protein BGZ50_003796 [Haplosporangium sp. Z 11]